MKNRYNLTMDEQIQNLIQQAKIGDYEAWLKIQRILEGHSVYPKYFYFLTIYTATVCRECHQPLLQRALDYPDADSVIAFVWVDSTGGDACETPSGFHELANVENDQLTYYFYSKKDALKFLIKIAERDLLNNSDEDLINPANFRETIKNWKQVFDPDYEIGRLKFETSI